MHDHSGHVHIHDHDHGAHSAEASSALLRYMSAHLRSHGEELHDLAHGLDGEAAALVHEAVALYEQAGGKLDAALALLRDAG